MNPKDQTLLFIDEAKRLSPSTFLNDLSSRKELLGESDWFDCEDKVWKIGENIRHLFLQNPSLKKDGKILDEILEVIKLANLRRGRQSFVLLLGFVGAKSYAPELALFLEDKDINGHVLDSLLKMKVGEYSQNVKPLLNSDKTWIKNLAKKYCERYLK